MNGRTVGIIPASSAPGYTTRLFDKSRVHTVDIIIDDWDEFLAMAEDEEYSACTLVIDGGPFGNVGLRTKGNNSKNLVSSISRSIIRWK